MRIKDTSDGAGEAREDLASISDPPTTLRTRPARKAGGHVTRLIVARVGGPGAESVKLSSLAGGTLTIPWIAIDRLETSSHPSSPLTLCLLSGTGGGRSWGGRK